jgi:exopolyphosphatase/guanosine-5'-triphosphate,3'-diphosphate pyrophosphatase
VRGACIDIGSNTTRLLVADCASGRLEPVAQERVFTHIARGRRADGTIPDEKIDEVAHVVAGQLRTALELGAVRVRAVATAAIRRAANGVQVVAAVHRACGLEVEVLTGEEEARLAFLGAASALDPVPTAEIGVVDVGGGSCEIAVGMAPDKIRWSASFGVGSSDLTLDCLPSDPPTQGELAVARERIAAALGRYEVPTPALALAVGGSAASLQQLAGAFLDSASLARALAVLTQRPAAAAARQFGLDPDRVRLLPAGLLILQAAAERLGRPLIVGGGGLREGVLLESES